MCRAGRRSAVSVGWLALDISDRRRGPGGPSRVGPGWHRDPPTGGYKITCRYSRELANSSRDTHKLASLSRAHLRSQLANVSRDAWRRRFRLPAPAALVHVGSFGSSVVSLSRRPARAANWPGGPPHSPRLAPRPPPLAPSPTWLPRGHRPREGSDAAPRPAPGRLARAVPPTAREPAGSRGGPLGTDDAKPRPHRRGGPLHSPPRRHARALYVRRPLVPLRLSGRLPGRDWPASPLHILSDPDGRPGRGAIVPVGENCWTGPGLLWGCTVHDHSAHAKWAAFLIRPDRFVRT